MFNNGASSVASVDEDEDENYLHDYNESNVASEWLDGVLNLSKTYELAGEQLATKLGMAQRICFKSASGTQGEGEKTSAFGEVTAHMLGVISDAFRNQIADKERNNFLTKCAKGDVDMNLIKAGILEEFEKSRDGYQNALHQARLISKERLKHRLTGQGADSKDTSDSAGPTQIEAMFEEGD